VFDEVFDTSHLTEGGDLHQTHHIVDQRRQSLLELGRIGPIGDEVSQFAGTLFESREVLP